MKTKILLLTLLGVFILIPVVNAGTFNLTLNGTALILNDGHMIMPNNVTDIAGPEMRIGNQLIIFRSFVTWNITQLPPGVNIDVLEFRYQGANATATMEANITALPIDPTVGKTDEAFWAVGNTTVFAGGLGSGFPTFGNNSISIINAAANLTNAATSGRPWWGIGMISIDEAANRDFNEITTENEVVPRLSPTLYIEYDFPVQYTLRGPFFENGTRSSTALTVTSTGVNVTIQTVLNGTAVVGANESITTITWEIQAGIFRRIRPQLDNGTFFIFLPEADFSQFAFTVKDYTSRIIGGDTLMETKRVVNGTEFIIESEIIQNTINPISFSMVLQRTYIIDFTFFDGSIARFGLFATLNDLTPTLLIKRSAFSRQVLLSYKFLFTEGFRVSANTQIDVQYLDTRNETILLQAFLNFRNGTLISELNSTSNNITLSFAGLVNTTNYIVDVTMTHQLGVFRQQFPFQGGSIFVAFPSLGNSSNTFGGLNGSAIIPSFIIIGSGLMFSAISAPAGALMTVLISVGLASVNAISISQDLIVTGVVLALILGFNRVRNR